MLKNHQFCFDLTDLFGTFVKQLQLIRLELVLSTVDRLQQEISVVSAVLDHRHTFVGREKHLLPKSAVFGKNGVFLLHQFLMKLGCFVLRARFHCHKGCNFRLFVSIIFLVVFACATGSKAEYQQECGQYG